MPLPKLVLLSPMSTPRGGGFIASIPERPARSNQSNQRQRKTSVRITHKNPRLLAKRKTSVGTRKRSTEIGDKGKKDSAIYRQWPAAALISPDAAARKQAIDALREIGGRPGSNSRVHIACKYTDNVLELVEQHQDSAIRADAVLALVECLYNREPRRTNEKNAWTTEPSQAATALQPEKSKRKGRSHRSKMKEARRRLHAEYHQAVQNRNALVSVRMQEAHMNTLDAQKYGYMFSRMLSSSSLSERAAVMQAFKELHLMFFVAEVQQDTVNAILDITKRQIQLVLAKTSSTVSQMEAVKQSDSLAAVLTVLEDACLASMENTRLIVKCLCNFLLSASMNEKTTASLTLQLLLDNSAIDWWVGKELMQRLNSRVKADVGLRSSPDKDAENPKQGMLGIDLSTGNSARRASNVSRRSSNASASSRANSRRNSRRQSQQRKLSLMLRAAELRTNLKIEILQVLASMGPKAKQFARYLLCGLEDEAVEVRCACVKLLCGSVWEGGDGGSVRTAQEAKTMGLCAMPACACQIAHCLNDLSPDVFCAAVQGLLCFGLLQPYFTVIMQRLEDENPRVRGHALGAVVGLGQARMYAPQIARLLGDENSSVRLDALRVLTQLGLATRYIDQIYQMLRDRDPAIKIAALEVLSGNSLQDDAQSAPPSGAFAGAGAGAATSAWAVDEPDAHTADPRILESDRRSLVHATAHRYCPTIVTRIRNDSSAAVRVKAVETVVALGQGSKHVDCFLERLDHHREKAASVREAALRALQSLGAEAGYYAPDVAALLGDEAPQVRAAACHTLHAIVDDISPMTADVVPLLEDPSADVRGAALTALAKAENACEYLPKIQVALGDRDLNVRSLAEKAIWAALHPPARTIVFSKARLVSESAKAFAPGIDKARMKLLKTDKRSMHNVNHALGES